MKYYSTKDRNKSVSLRVAVLNGMDPGGGLYMPAEIPEVSNYFSDNISNLSFDMIARYIAIKFFSDDIPLPAIEKIIETYRNYEISLVNISSGLSVLELFHGPTLAFKDVGAMFFAALISCFAEDLDKEITILAATSGDTGSAVANSFHKVKGVKVVLLYPSKKVSRIQEQQITTLGDNISALEIEGTFDDCQKLVKCAFRDDDLKKELSLTSANSINIARLLPQTFYYFYAGALVEKNDNPLVFSVPSGNLGNLTSGLLAKKMGLKVDKFIAATNSNNVFTAYLDSGVYKPGTAVRTLSNAMDVGSPSNFERILDLYESDLGAIKRDIYSVSTNDDETISSIREVFGRYNYIFDPHGAVGYSALRKYVNETGSKNINGIILETAHYTKFGEIIENTLNMKVELPSRLKKCLYREKKSEKLSNDYNRFKEYLLNMN